MATSRKKKTAPAKKDAAVDKVEDAEATSQSTAAGQEDGLSDRPVSGAPADPPEQAVDGEVMPDVPGGETAVSKPDLAAQDARKSDETSGAASNETSDDTRGAAPILPAPVVTQPAPQRSVFWPLVLGGLAAAVIGFVAARYVIPQSWPLEAVPNAETMATINGLKTQLADSQAALEALDARATTLDAQVQDAAASAEAAMRADDDRLADLQTQIDALQPDPDAAELPADLQALLDQQKDRIEALQGELEQMADFAQGQIAAAQTEQEDAAAAAARAEARDALNAVRLALASGAAYAEALPMVAGAVDVPDGLSAPASDGVETLNALQQSFPETARTALASALRETAGDTPTDRVKLFFQEQFGTRSLQARDGDDPDAVLSRAEAAVNSGDLGAALETIEALPQTGRAKLETWSQMARTRVEAEAAFATVSDALSAD